jgi:hypothetical protein
MKPVQTIKLDLKEDKMSHFCKSLAVRIFMVLFILFILNTNFYSLIIANRGEEAFEDNLENGLSIKSGIIDGAGFFLKSYADSLLFLKEIEWSEPGNVDYKELSNLLGRTMDNIRNANEAYAKLKVMADAAPYSRVFIDKLTSFDYTGFQQDRSFNGTAFAAVKKYLAVGDVRGIFAHMLSAAQRILNMLRDIRASIEAEKFPALSSLWRLNQLFSETMIFGQISAEIFYEIGCGGPGGGFSKEPPGRRRQLQLLLDTTPDRNKTL